MTRFIISLTPPPRVPRRPLGRFLRHFHSVLCQENLYHDTLLFILLAISTQVLSSSTRTARLLFCRKVSPGVSLPVGDHSHAADTKSLSTYYHQPLFTQYVFPETNNPLMDVCLQIWQADFVQAGCFAADRLGVSERRKDLYICPSLFCFCFFSFLFILVQWFFLGKGVGIGATVSPAGVPMGIGHVCRGRAYGNRTTLTRPTTRGMQAFWAAGGIWETGVRRVAKIGGCPRSIFRIDGQGQMERTKLLPRPGNIHTFFTGRTSIARQDSPSLSSYATDVYQHNSHKWARHV